MNGTVSIKGSKNLFPWDIGHFLELTGLNYLKVMYITRICELYAKDLIVDDILFIEKNNFYQHEKDDFDFQIKNPVYLVGKSASPENFWYLLRKNSRPLIYIRKENYYTPLFLEESNELVFKSVKVASPPEINASGFLPALIELFFGIRRDAREDIDFQNRQLGQIAQNVQHIVSASQIVNDPKTPPGVKAYAINVLSEVIEKQSRLNEKLGLEILHIDERL
jgi:hypothetical protein